MHWLSWREGLFLKIKLRLDLSVFYRFHRILGLRHKTVGFGVHITGDLPSFEKKNIKEDFGVCMVELYR